MAFFGKARTCTVMAQEKDDNSKHCTSIQEKDCCDSQTLVKPGDDSFKKSTVILEVETLAFLSTFIDSFIDLFELLENSELTFQAYRPPLLSFDIIILNETFLI